MEISELTGGFSSWEYSDIEGLVSQLNPELRMTEQSLQSCVDDPNSHLYVLRDEASRIVGCAMLCVFHQPFNTVGSIESVVVRSDCRGRGYGRLLVEHILGEARKMAPIELHLTSSPFRTAAISLYESLGFKRYSTNNLRLMIEEP